jgi:hypothetical protein
MRSPKRRGRAGLAPDVCWTVRFFDHKKFNAAKLLSLAGYEGLIKQEAKSAPGKGPLDRSREAVRAALRSNRQEGGPSGGKNRKPAHGSSNDGDCSLSAETLRRTRACGESTALPATFNAALSRLHSQFVGCGIYGIVDSGSESKFPESSEEP